MWRNHRRASNRSGDARSRRLASSCGWASARRDRGFTGPYANSLAVAHGTPHSAHRLRFTSPCEPSTPHRQREPWYLPRSAAYGRTHRPRSFPAARRVRAERDHKSAVEVGTRKHPDDRQEPHRLEYLRQIFGFQRCCIAADGKVRVPRCREANQRCAGGVDVERALCRLHDGSPCCCRLGGGPGWPARVVRKGRAPSSQAPPRRTVTGHESGVAASDCLRLSDSVRQGGCPRGAPKETGPHRDTD